MTAEGSDALVINGKRIQEHQTFVERGSPDVCGRLMDAGAYISTIQELK